MESTKCETQYITSSAVETGHARYFSRPLILDSFAVQGDKKPDLHLTGISDHDAPYDWSAHSTCLRRQCIDRVGQWGWVLDVLYILASHHPIDR